MVPIHGYVDVSQINPEKKNQTPETNEDLQASVKSP